VNSREWLVVRLNICQFEWILLLKKVKFLSRTRLNVKLKTTSRYNFLSKSLEVTSESWVVSREIEYMPVRVNFAFEKSEICIENSIKRKTSNYFSIQFSIENHSKWRVSLEWWAWIHVSSSEFDFWKKWNLYRELFLAQNFITLLDTIFYRKSLEVTALRRQVPR